MCSFNKYIALDFLVMLNSNKKNNLESGLNHWLFQKVTAALLIPITIWVLLKLPKFIQLSFSDKLSWINSSLNLYLIALFFIISAFHFKLGLTVIIEDYIHNSIVVCDDNGRRSRWRRSTVRRGVETKDDTRVYIYIYIICAHRQQRARVKM